MTNSNNDNMNNTLNKVNSLHDTMDEAEQILVKLNRQLVSVGRFQDALEIKKLHKQLLSICLSM